MHRVEEIALPLSGRIFQWRTSDNHWRRLTERSDESDVDWEPWTGDSSVQLEADGDVWSHPSWLLAWGELPATGQIEISHADDGTTIPHSSVGRIWAAEWIGQGAPISIEYDDNPPYVMRIDRPMYL